ncbi:MAG: hypothetical protein RBR19_03855 [Sedimentisphaerales bacterium]|jgi:hypothetical protein|nr:hypothetical protein [Sedimentisphaerales bacterium]NLT75570.1 hypothetical protein [Planctomycetota bacterium]
MKLNPVVCAITLLSCLSSLSVANEPAPTRSPLSVGWSAVDITPNKPVALVGQLHKRISQRVLDPLTATALALETKGADGQCEQAILISCDVLYIRKSVLDEVRSLVRSQLPEFDADKLALNATHTHTGPGFTDADFGTLYDVSTDEGVMKASEYGRFFAEKVAQAAVSAWRSRKAGGMSWGLGHAVVGMNRRARYFDGSAVMYGATNRPDFAGVEGYEDHAVEMLFFWDGRQKPSGLVINIACPSQETEGLNEISADFWHDVREELRKRIAADLFVLPQCAVAGDLSPHLLFRSRAEQAMMQQRGLSRRQEIARRIVNAVEEAMPLAQQRIETDVAFGHIVARVNLPPAKSVEAPFYTTDTIAPVELHVLRLGDIAMATNPFELYLDYGIRMKARSPAMLTLLVQLSCQHCGYLPTAKAVQGGGYSADKFVVGPEGGQVLVDETLRRIDALWR